MGNILAFMIRIIKHFFGCGYSIIVEGPEGNVNSSSSDPYITVVEGLV